MLEKTSSIVIKNTPYKETSSIVTIYTKDFGLKTFIIKGGRKKNAVVASSIFQPLQILSIVFYQNHKNTLQQIKEYSISYNLQNIYLSIIKTSLAFFLTEVISLSIKEENPNEEVFSFLESSIVLLSESEDKQLKDFHLFFLYRFATLLGFQPMDNYSDMEEYFDIEKGRFVGCENTSTMSKPSSLLFHLFLLNSKDNNPLTKSQYERNEILSAFILFFEHHITNNKPIKSQQILKTIL
jgi:DNA repair protein RecO (recombination protein O)